MFSAHIDRGEQYLVKTAILMLKIVYLWMVVSPLLPMTKESSFKS